MMMMSSSPPTLARWKSGLLSGKRSGGTESIASTTMRQDHGRPTADGCSGVATLEDVCETGTPTGTERPRTASIIPKSQRTPFMIPLSVTGFSIGIPSAISGAGARHRVSRRRILFYAIFMLRVRAPLALCKPHHHAKFSDVARTASALHRLVKMVRFREIFKVQVQPLLLSRAV